MPHHLIQELELLDENNNPLTHAKYHREQVKEAGERDRRPFSLRVPEYLEDKMREYLAQVSLTSCDVFFFFSYAKMFDIEGKLIKHNQVSIIFAN